jgi:hypothetical protein
MTLALLRGGTDSPGLGFYSVDRAMDTEEFRGHNTKFAEPGDGVWERWGLTAAPFHVADGEREEQDPGRNNQFRGVLDRGSKEISIGPVHQVSVTFHFLLCPQGLSFIMRQSIDLVGRSMNSERRLHGATENRPSPKGEAYIMIEDHNLPEEEPVRNEAIAGQVISPLGLRLRAIRKKFLDEGGRLLAREELVEEITERRGGVSRHDQRRNH